MIKSNSFHYQAIKWQSEFFGAGLPVSKCSYAWRVFFTLVILPFVAVSTVYGLFFIAPVFITDPRTITENYNIFVGMWFLLCAGLAVIFGIVFIGIAVAEWCERCEPVEYDD